MKAANEGYLLELNVIDLPTESTQEYSLKKKCCKKYKKKGKHCKKCPKLLLADPKVNFSSAPICCEA